VKAKWVNRDKAVETALAMYRLTHKAPEQWVPQGLDHAGQTTFLSTYSWQYVMDWVLGVFRHSTADFVINPEFLTHNQWQRFLKLVMKKHEKA